MGTHLKVDYTRSVTTNDQGNEIFEILSECSDKGLVDQGTGLNDTGIFLFSIFNSRNAAADVFQRVCTINDLEVYLDDRDAAIAANQEYWRNYTLTRTYTELTTAVSAVRALDDRINALVNDYATYIGQFKTDPSPAPGTYETYPTADPDYVTELKADYATTVEDFETDLAASTAAKTTRDNAVTALSDAQTDLEEWQEAQLKVCGGDINAVAYQVGLSSYVTDIANAFKNLFDNTGAVPPPHYDTYVKGTGGVKDVMDTFIASVENVQMGNGPVETEKLTVTAGTNPVPGDIGRAVTATAGSGTATGYLVAYDIANHFWWVVNVAATGDWNTGDTVAVTGGTGSGQLDAHAPAPLGPLDGLSLLEDSRDDLGTTIDAISITDGILAKANAASGAATAACVYITDITAEKAIDVTTAETAISTAETAYIEAQAATQAAYAAVTAAYTAVKAVCPDWSPVPPVPAAP